MKFWSNKIRGFQPRFQRTYRVALGMFLAGIIALSGCAQSKNTDVPSPSSSVAIATPSGPVEIKFLNHLSPTPNSDINSVITNWNQSHPNIQISNEYKEVNEDEYNQNFSELGRQSGACLAQVGYDHLPNFAQKGLLLDVTKQVEKYKSSYYPGPWNLMSSDSARYGVPLSSGALVYFYRPVDRGWVKVSRAESWQEYWDGIKNSREGGTFASVFMSREAAKLISAMAAAEGEQWYSVSRGAWKVILESHITKQIMENWQKSLDEGTSIRADIYSPEFGEDVENQLINGYIGPAESLFAFANREGSGGTNTGWQIAQVPGKQTGNWGGQGIAVLTGCKYPQQAIEFANWYATDGENLLAQQLIPAAKVKIETPTWLQRRFGGQDVLAELASATENMNPNWKFSPTWPQIEQLFNKMVNDGYSLTDVLKQIQYESIKTLEDQKIKVDR